MNQNKKLMGITSMTTITLVIFNCCSGIPKGATAVKPFDLQKYLGKWYEIARMDFKFEQDLKNVIANYSLNANGTIRVENQGYNYVTNKQMQSIGKAKLAGKKDEAKLKVSFFGPFYSGYNVLAIDEQYKYALVAGKSLKYLWLLSRDKTMPDDVKQNYLKIARSLGYNTDVLIWTQQD